MRRFFCELDVTEKLTVHPLKKEGLIDIWITSTDPSVAHDLGAALSPKRVKALIAELRLALRQVKP